MHIDSSKKIDLKMNDYHIVINSKLLYKLTFNIILNNIIHITLSDGFFGGWLDLALKL